MHLPSPQPEQRLVSLTAELQWVLTELQGPEEHPPRLPRCPHYWKRGNSLWPCSGPPLRPQQYFFCFRSVQGTFWRSLHLLGSPQAMTACQRGVLLDSSSHAAAQLQCCLGLPPPHRDVTEAPESLSIGSFPRVHISLQSRGNGVAECCSFACSANITYFTHLAGPPGARWTVAAAAEGKQRR